MDDKLKVYANDSESCRALESARASFFLPVDTETDEEGHWESLAGVGRVVEAGESIRLCCGQNRQE